MTNTIKLTRHGRALTTATNETIAELREKNWLCYIPDNNPDVLFLDAKRTLLINNESFNSVNTNPDDNNDALKSFIGSVFSCSNPSKDPSKENIDKLIQFWNQSLYGQFVTAMLPILIPKGLVPNSNGPDTYRANIQLDEKGIFYVEIINSNFFFKNIKSGEDVIIPGVITSRFTLTDHGFQLQDVEFSNSILQNICLNNSNDINNNNAVEEELLLFKTVLNSSKTEENLKKIGRDLLNNIQSLNQSALNAMCPLIPLATKLLQDPLNQICLLAFDDCLNHLEKATNNRDSHFLDHARMLYFHCQAAILDKMLNDEQYDSRLRTQGKRILDEVIKFKSDPATKAKIIIATNQLIKNSNNEDATRFNIKNYRQLAKDIGNKRQGSKMLSKMMLDLAKFALVIAMTPLAIPFVTLAFGIRSGMTLFNYAKKPAIQNEMEKMAKFADNPPVKLP